jgi:hypothetical protein
MRRTLAVFMAVLAMLVLAVPAGANAPSGQGLISFGTASCGDLGDFDVFGPRGESADTAFTTTGIHVVVVTITGVFMDTEGNVVDMFSKSYGAKAGLTSVTCTQHIEAPGEGSGDLTVVVAIIPPG